MSGLQNTDLSQRPGPLLALLVDDNKDSLYERRHLLEQSGFSVIPANSDDVAEREFIASPGISIAFVDVRLHTEIPNDKSGIRFARLLRAVHQDLPIVGYSGAFGEDDLSESEWDVFTSRFARGSSTAREIMQRLSEWKQLAVSFRNNRSKSARDHLGELRAKHGPAERNFTQLRLLAPHGVVSDPQSPTTVEETLRRAGYTLRLVERGQSRPTVEGQSVPVPHTICIWTQDCGDHHLAELYGAPDIYSTGDTEEEAMENLLILMDGYLKDLTEVGEGGRANSRRVAELSSYLKRLLGSPRGD
jgi:CheY-like chemotaxis protein